jgi:hypothetical protein
MSALQQLDKLVQEIKLFMRYAVPENEMMTAVLVVDRYRNDRRALSLLREYYIALPDAREEAAIRIACLMQQQGVFLLVLQTTTTAHLYAVSVDVVVLLGEYPCDLETDILAFWGFTSQEEFRKLCIPPADLEDYVGSADGNRGECPACGVAEGELHFLGCSVEVCPWCEGQLNKCNCRFEQLEVDAVDDEEQLERFFELLLAKGRIPFQRQQAPYYPGTSDGLDKDEKKR